MKKWHMLQEEDHVIAGISEGTDSVCLLFMLEKLQKEMGFGEWQCMFITAFAVQKRKQMRIT